MWFNGKHQNGTKILFNSDDVDAFQVDQPDNEKGEDKPFFVYGRVGSTWISVFTGTQVECIRFQDEIARKLNVIDIEVWN